MTIYLVKLTCLIIGLILAMVLGFLLIMLLKLLAIVGGIIVVIYCLYKVIMLEYKEEDDD